MENWLRKCNLLLRNTGESMRFLGFFIVGLRLFENLKIKCVFDIFDVVEFSLILRKDVFL